MQQVLLLSLFSRCEDRYKEVKWFARDHTTRVCWNMDLNKDSQTPIPALYVSEYTFA